MNRLLLTALLFVALYGSTSPAFARVGDFYYAVDYGAVCDGTTDTRAAINAAITAANTAGSGTVMLPRGVCRVDLSAGRIVAKSNVTLTGQGIGVSTILVDDTSGGTDAISNSNGGSTFTPLDHFALRDLTVQGLADTIHTSGGQLIRLSGTNLVIERVESRYSRNFGMVIVGSDNVAVRDCVIYRTIGDGIAVWSTPNAIITGNRITGSNDDAISAHSSNNDAAPVRSGIIIANNTITESQGISTLGPKVISIHDNVMRRIMSYGIHLEGSGRAPQGDTPIFAVSIHDNVITDVFLRSEPSPRNQTHNYIWINGGPWQAGTLIAVPGEPEVGTGTVADLYGSDTGTFYVNDTNIPTTPAPGNYWIDIHDNIFTRTLPAVAHVSDWGYPSSESGLWVGNNGDGSGFYNGPISEAKLNTNGIYIGGPLRKTRIARNRFNTTGPYCIDFIGGSSKTGDFDGLDIEGNTCRDFSMYGIFLTVSVTQQQRIRITDNDFNGDPRFRGAGRGPHGTWTGIGYQTGVPGAIFLPYVYGVVITGNQFRNVALADYVVSAPIHLYHDNLLVGQPTAVGFNTANAGIGTWPVLDDGWRALIEDSDPTSATYGQVLFAPPSSATAMPMTGIWARGAWVANSATMTGAQPCGQVTHGWRRVTTGSGNLLHTDWQPAMTTLTQTDAVSLGNGDNHAVPTSANLVVPTTTGGTIAGATITLPDPASEPQFCRIAFAPSGIVTTLSVMSAGGGSVVGAPSTMAPGAPFAFVLNGTTWTRAP
jgi:polygalacturonase